jgi:phosphomannomutase
MSSENLKAIFKAYDVRGEVDSQLNKDIVKKTGRAFADWLPNKGIVAVGHDMRPSSPRFAKAIIEGLTKQGLDVWDIGQVTTDMVYFAVGKNDLAGGVMITASHNPAQFNGIKICARGAQAVGIESGLADIRDLVLKNEFKPVSTVGKAIKKDVTIDWVNFVLSFIDTNKLLPLRVAIDAGNGMAGKIFPEIEPYLPFDVTEMFFELDGTFPNHEANPQKTETLNELVSTIKKGRLDGGIAFDGDGDRAFLVDELGKVLSGSAMTAMLAEYFIEKHPGSKIVHGLTSSNSVADIIKLHGGQPIRSKTGHSFIKKVMREVDAPFGGEASGHFYFRDNWYADSGLIAALIGLYILSTSDKRLSQLRTQYEHYAMLPETNFEIADKEAAIARLKKAFAHGEHDFLDGLSVDFDDGSWFNVRPSNTEPVLRLNAEAKTKKQLNELVTKVTKVITS